MRLCCLVQDASVYTASRDDMLRELNESVETVDGTMEAELSGMDLPHALHAVEREIEIPDGIIQALSRAQGSGGADVLLELVDSLPQRASDVHGKCMAIDALLDVEEGADQQLQQARRIPRSRRIRSPSRIRIRVGVWFEGND